MWPHLSILQLWCDVDTKVEISTEILRTNNIIVLWLSSDIKLLLLHFINRITRVDITPVLDKVPFLVVRRIESTNNCVSFSAYSAVI